MGDWKEDSLRHKYAPLPEDAPRHHKKSKKVHIRSDHRHQYENVAIDTGNVLICGGRKCPYVVVTRRCKVCGRLGETLMTRTVELDKVHKGMRLFKVDGLLEFYKLKGLPEELEVER